MKAFQSTIASILLLLNGLGAIYGGWKLITRPDGSSMRMSVSLLEQSPFQDFLLPGLGLLVLNGLPSLIAFVGMLANPRKFAWVVWAQGVILCTWITIQVIMIEMLHPLHLVCLAAGLVLILIGRNQSRPKFD
ncbi:hypothetical protein [Emticicia sp. TH156]|uniref:hypothetical protein n=1 Tax=Emticicia sp. TH156 TaxID=2067454 RepID=UPI000C77B0B8|nr:hypothetical protein [Emticicia sp. TH156]PLK45132.1 hypothetical protein C0V77_07825 [Emticicia sp. TH156]